MNALSLTRRNFVALFSLVLFAHSGCFGNAGAVVGGWIIRMGYWKDLDVWDDSAHWNG